MHPLHARRDSGFGSAQVLRAHLAHRLAHAPLHPPPADLPPAPIYSHTPQLDIAFRQRGPDGEPLKQGPPEIADQLGLPLERATALLAAAKRAVPLAADTDHPVEVLYEDDDLIAGPCSHASRSYALHAPSGDTPEAMESACSGASCAGTVGGVARQGHGCMRAMRVAAPGWAEQRGSLHGC